MELIIVIAIIAILAAIVIPDSNFSYVAASIIAKSQLASEPIKKEVEKYYYKNKQFPEHKAITAPILTPFTTNEPTRGSKAVTRI